MAFLFCDVYNMRVRMKKKKKDTSKLTKTVGSS